MRGITKRVVILGLAVAIAAIGIGALFIVKQQQVAAKSALLSGHNAFDFDFATSMIIHDQQALLMADTALTQSTNPDVKALAASIKAKSGSEVAKLKGWVTGWGQKYNDLSDFPQMSGHDMYPTLPGMASVEELRTLPTLTGTTFNNTFLTMMIAHHQGAIEMTQTETANGQNGATLALAKSIASTQAAEIKTMEKLIGSMK